jgi:hypothetical protein
MNQTTTITSVGERRLAHRVTLNGEALIWPGAAELVAEGVDLSFSGVGLRSFGEVREGEKLSVRLRLFPWAPQIELPAEVVRFTAGDGRTGLRFLSLDGLAARLIGDYLLAHWHEPVGAQDDWAEE